MTSVTEFTANEEHTCYHFDINYYLLLLLLLLLFQIHFKIMIKGEEIIWTEEGRGNGGMEEIA